MLNRLLLLIHWIGFLCLSVIVGYIILGLIFGDQDPLVGVIEFLWDCFTGENDWMSVALWIAILHWPLNWIVTGDKAIFPWRRNQ